MRNALAPASDPDPAIRLKQSDSGGEFFVRSLEVVTESEQPIQFYPKIRWDWTG